VSELAALRPLVDGTGAEGTVLVYDLRRDRYHGVYAGRAHRRLIPASTFKIVNALAALDAGIVAGPASVIAWDGVTRERTELNRDLNLQSAFRLSAVPHFQWLARRLGPERLQRAVDGFGYGNRDIGGGIDRFWLTGALRVSPAEQIALLVRLRGDALPVAPAAMAAVREMMVVERTPTHTIRAKTGWATTRPREVGWWVGWVERGAEVYFFATALEHAAPGPAFAADRLRVTRHVLAALGALDEPAEPPEPKPPRGRSTAEEST
jgi:beta-lactamase class D